MGGSVALAQFTGNSYWETLPPPMVTAPAKAPHPAVIPNVPFAPVPNVSLAGITRLDKDFKLLGPWPPLWLGSKAVALLGTIHGQIRMMVWEGNHFAHSRVIADPQTVGGGAILDMAVSRSGDRLAIAVDAGDKLQIWVRDTQGEAPASVAATINGHCEKAGLGWLDPKTLAVGAQSSAPPPPASDESPIITPEQQSRLPAQPEPSRTVYVVQLGQDSPPTALDFECLKHLDPAKLTWSPDGHYAIATTGETKMWTLVDRDKAGCETLNLPNIAPAAVIDWDDKSSRFLFTATPPGSPDPGHIGVMEYIMASRKARLLASPAAAAAYASGGKVAVLGSQHLNARAIAAKPTTLYPAEIGWIDRQAQIDIVPTGFTSTAPALLSAHLTYSAARNMLAATFLTPHPNGAFAVLMWLSSAAHNGGVLGTGRKGTMLPAWAPDGSKLAVLAGLPDHPTLAIVAAPR